MISPVAGERVVKQFADMQCAWRVRFSGVNDVNVTFPPMVAALCAALAISSLPVSRAQAENYPTRALTWVVPFAPGGLADVGARMVARKLSENLGQPVVIENKPGAGGIVGAEAVANAKPDGYTFYYGAAAPMAVNVSLYKKLSYDPLTSFEPVHGMAMSPLVIATNPSKPYKTFDEFIAYARKNPGKLNYSSPGVGTAHHLAGELISVAANIQMNHIPYKGAAPAMADVMAGVIDVMFDNLLPIKTQLADGKLLPLAVTSATRLPTLPDVPTAAERGYPSIIISSWSSVALPAKTPQPIVDRLAAAFATVMKDPEIVKYFEGGGAIVMADVSKDRLRDFYASEIAKFRELVVKSGATAN